MLCYTRASLAPWKFSNLWLWFHACVCVCVSRYVFTIADLDVVAPAYYYFMEQLESLLGLSLTSFSEKEKEFSSASSSKNIPNQPTAPVVVPQTSILTSPGGKTIQLSILPISLQTQVLPQYFCYERTKDLVLWHIQST